MPGGSHAWVLPLTIPSWLPGTRPPSHSAVFQKLSLLLPRAHIACFSPSPGAGVRLISFTSIFNN